MTRKGPRKSVSSDFWKGRLDSARTHRTLARDGATLAEETNDGRAIVSLIVLAAIAYADALTAYRAGVANQQDHAAAPKLLRDVLKNELPERQAKNFRDLIEWKDGANYGARRISLAKARELLVNLDSFGEWAEGLLPR